MADVLWQLESVKMPASARRRGLFRRGAEPRDRFACESLSIHRGVTAVIGGSGSGKTTLLNLLAGFETSKVGSVTSSAPANNGQLSLFWSPDRHGLWPHLSVRKHLEAVRPSTAPASCDTLLDRFDLTHVADALPAELSQGERSRLAVARTLAADPAVMVMDEPLAHVDPTHVDRYWQLIREHVVARDCTLVFSTHRPETVLAMAERVICLQAGRVAYAGDVASLYWRAPDESLARCLGEVNWLTANDWATWFHELSQPGGDGHGPSSAATQRLVDPPSPCVRPESLRIERDAASSLVVVDAVFAGSVERLTVEKQPAGPRRRFVHRPAGQPLQPGDRVSLRLTQKSPFADGQTGEAPRA